MMNVQKTIDLFGGVRPMALKLGHKFPTTVQNWKKNNKFPSWRILEIQLAASENDIKLSMRDIEVDGL